MKVKKNQLIKLFPFLFLIAFSNNLAYSYEKSNYQGSNLITPYNAVFKLNMNEEIHFEDSLKISLRYFSHKRPYLGGSTKATAIIKVSKRTIVDELGLSIRGTEGQSGAESYGSVVWMEYTFLLKKFDYDESIELVVYKND